MYRVGLIGCGEIAEAHATGFAETGRARIVLAYDAIPEVAARWAAGHDAAVAESAEAVIGSDVDAVVVATPGFVRREFVVPAAAAGKHILCEKPVALNLEDAEAMREAVTAGGGVFQVHFLKRFQAPTVALHGALEAGLIGGTASAWARWHAPAPTARWLEIEARGHWRSSKALSGGRINEFCSHAVNWLIWILGRPLTVYGKALRVTDGFSLDDADMAIFECERGVGLLDVNRHAGVAEEDNYGIVGHGGSVVLKDGVVRLTPMDGETRELPVEADGVSPHEHFLRCIETGSAPRNGIDDAIATLEACLAFNRSAASGRVERI